MNKGFKEDFLTHLKKFSDKDKELFDSIYWFRENVGHLLPPREMISWIEFRESKKTRIFKNY